MRSVALIPVAFSSLRQLIAIASRFCGRESAVLRVRRARRTLEVGDTLRLALLTPEVRFPIDVNATILACTARPMTVRVRYTLADHSQIECALGQLYQRSEPRLPIALDVDTAHHRTCRLAELSSVGATFEVLGVLSPRQCTPDSEAWLQLPHPDGALSLPGHVAWVSPRADRSRMHVTFSAVTATTRKSLNDIVCRFRLGAAPWTPRLLAPGV
jgi:hypothetical protein